MAARKKVVLDSAHLKLRKAMNAFTIMQGESLCTSLPTGFFFVCFFFRFFSPFRTGTPCSGTHVCSWILWGSVNASYGDPNPCSWNSPWFPLTDPFFHAFSFFSFFLSCCFFFLPPFPFSFLLRSPRLLLFSDPSKPLVREKTVFLGG